MASLPSVEHTERCLALVEERCKGHADSQHEHGEIVLATTPQHMQTLATIYNQSLEARDASMEVIPKKAEDFAALCGAMRQCRDDDGTIPEGYFVVEPAQAFGCVKRYSDRKGYGFACETSIYLDRALMGKGLGLCIQLWLMRKAKEWGYRHATVKIFTANERSIGMHKQCGFVEVGVQHGIGFLDGKFRDVTILEALL